LVGGGGWRDEKPSHEREKRRYRETRGGFSGGLLPEVRWQPEGETASNCV
jgi:hypothetical protein